MMYLNIQYIQVINFYARTEGSVEQMLLKAKKKKKKGKYFRCADYNCVHFSQLMATVETVMLTFKLTGFQLVLQ